MTRNLVGSKAWTILGLLLVAVPCFPGTRMNNVGVTVRLRDYANLPAGVRRKAADTATRILRMAGLTIEFVECFSGGVKTGTPACTGPPGPADFVLRIYLPKFAEKYEHLAYSFRVPEYGGEIMVFVDPARRRARVSNLDDATLVGHAVVHEIGHLLLGENAHSPSGIMRPVWTRHDEEWMLKGVLPFSAAEAKRMRSAVVERTSRTSPTPVVARQDVGSAR